jgi:hypothetical protein
VLQFSDSGDNIGMMQFNLVGAGSKHSINWLERLRA